MRNDFATNRSAVKRRHAENYILISLLTFAASVVFTRLFLQATGYPQLGNDTLHIAHALWGGLILTVSTFLPLIFANRWILSLSAALNGLGIGLFIDEVGKFITQTNDYFYPPAAPLIYAFFLLMVLVYLYVQRIGKTDERTNFYYVLSDLRELADNNLDAQELQLILDRLRICAQSDQLQIARITAVIEKFFQQSEIPLVPESPGFDKVIKEWLRNIGIRIGQKRLRIVIVIGMVMMAFEVLFSIAFILSMPFSSKASLQTLVSILLSRAGRLVTAREMWFYLRIILEILTGLLTLTAAFLIVRGREYIGLHIGLIGLLLSLTGLLLLNFYLNQFGALSMALTQFPFLLIVLSYRRWFFPYIPKPVRKTDQL